LRKSSEILIEKKFRNFRRIAKNGEAKRIRFAEKNLVFAFASLFDSKKQSLSQSIFGRNLKPWLSLKNQPKTAKIVEISKKLSDSGLLESG
jgi:hypothetical protein